MSLVLVPLVALLLVALLLGVRGPRRPGRPFYRRTGGQYRRHYHSRRNFLRLGTAVAGVTVLAYSGIDEQIEQWHAEEIKGPVTDALARFLHLFGNRPWFLYWGLLALIDGFWHSSALSRWGGKSFEAMVVGLPSLWVTQRALGAARPSDGTHGPRFRPFADDNTASGHTFIAAIPCLVAARMARGAPLRITAYAVSPLTGWSRLNDRRHYPSQILLGYGLAWQAVETVMAPAAAGGGTAPGPEPRDQPLGESSPTLAAGGADQASDGSDAT